MKYRAVLFRWKVQYLLLLISKVLHLIWKPWPQATILCAVFYYFLLFELDTFLSSISVRFRKLHLYQIKYTFCSSGISIHQCKIVTLKFHQFVVWPLLHHLQIFRYRNSKDCDIGVNCSNERFAIFLSYIFCTVKPGWWSHKYSFNDLLTYILLLLIFFLPQILDFITILWDTGYYVEVA